MKGNEAMSVARSDLDRSTSLSVNDDASARASVAPTLARDDVAIGASRQTGVQVHVQVILVIVDGNEASVASAEGDLVAFVVPPPWDIGSLDDVAEVNHVGDFAPAMLAYPRSLAIALCSDDR